MKFLFDIHKQKKSPLQKNIMLIPPYIKSFIKQENKHFLFKIKYVLFDKIEGMILL